MAAQVLTLVLPLLSIVAADPHAPPPCAERDPPASVRVITVAASTADVPVLNDTVGQLRAGLHARGVELISGEDPDAALPTLLIDLGGLSAATIVLWAGPEPIEQRIVDLSGTPREAVAVVLASVAEDVFLARCEQLVFPAPDHVPNVTTSSAPPDRIRRSPGVSTTALLGASVAASALLLPSVVLVGLGASAFVAAVGHQWALFNATALFTIALAAGLPLLGGAVAGGAATAGLVWITDVTTAGTVGLGAALGSVVGASAAWAVAYVVFVQGLLVDPRGLPVAPPIDQPVRRAFVFSRVYGLPLLVALATSGAVLGAAIGGAGGAGAGSLLVAVVGAPLDAELPTLLPWIDGRWAASE